MNREEFEKLLNSHLLPIFTGASLGASEDAKPFHKLVAKRNVCTLLIKPSKDADYRVQFLRSQEFLEEEVELIEHFVSEVKTIDPHRTQDHFKDLMALLPRRVIGRLLGGEGQGRSTLEEAIRWFESLASQTYEGKQIVAAFGITGSMSYGPIDISSLSQEDFSKVLSNGFDTIYQCGQDGKIFNITRLSVAYPDSHAPVVRMGAVANWARGNRIALVLNRNGEILVFKNKMLKFAKRRGSWRYYPHESALKQFGRGIKADIKSAIYQSCLDASFARTGGCIAVLTRDGERELRKRKIVHSTDMIVNKESIRTKLLAKAIKKPFQDVDRLLRQELLAIDGAIILDNQGGIITAGAIIKVPEGSISGGRRAAAVNLSKWGIGIKISADGPILGFKKRNEIFSL